MERPSSDYCQTWLSLFELFESASGLKLRINVADTVLVKDSRIVGWFFTSRDGVVCRASNHEISSQTVFQKLVGSQASCNANLNPYNYIALAHFESGVSRPLKQAELQQLLQNLGGPYDTSCSWPEGQADSPFCIQAYIPPLKDLRYIASSGGPEGLQACSTFARRFSLRYTHTSDTGPPPVPQASQGRTPSTVASTATHQPAPLTAEEMLVESQLVALGLLEPRAGPSPSPSTSTMRMHSSPQLGSSSSQPGSPRAFTPSAAAAGGGGWEGLGAAEASLPTSKGVKAEIQRVVQTLQSFIERAHGLRMQGLVAEFIQSTLDTVVLVAVHAVQWDSRPSRGRLGTFTDRWTDYVAGAGPAPAARPTSKRNFAPAMLMSCESPSASMASAAPAPATDGILSGRGFPWAHNQQHINETVAVYDARPGSAPTVLMQRYRPNTYNPRQQPSGSGSPAGASGSLESSYALWMARDGLGSETIAGALALELEVVRDKVQRQASSTARAEAALSSMAVSSKQTHDMLAAQIEDLQSELSAVKTRKKDMHGQYERLRSERLGLKTQISSLREDVQAAKSMVEQERATLASQVRTAQSKEESMEEAVRNLAQENEGLGQQVSLLQRRADEGNEVLDAIKTQLLDYRSMVAMLQSQLRRGKNSINVAPGAAGALGPVGDEKWDDLAAFSGGKQGGGMGARQSSSSRPGSALSRPGRR